MVSCLQPYLDLVAQVDHICVWDDLRHDPFSIFDKLQALDVLHQDGEAGEVRVLLYAHRTGRVRMRRVMVHQKRLLVILPEVVIEARRVQPQTLRDELHQVLAQLFLLLEVFLLCVSARLNQEIYLQ